MKVGGGTARLSAVMWQLERTLLSSQDDGKKGEKCGRRKIKKKDKKLGIKEESEERISWGKRKLKAGQAQGGHINLAAKLKIGNVKQEIKT